MTSQSKNVNVMMRKKPLKTRLKKKDSKAAGTATAGANKGVLICPRCASVKIIPHYKDTKHRIEHGDPLEAYYSRRACVNCGYVGYFFPDVPKNKIKLIKAEIKKLMKR